MRITLFSNYVFMTYDYYSEQPKPMCENELNQLLHKNPQLINNLFRFTFHPPNQKYKVNQRGENTVYNYF